MATNDATIIATKLSKDELENSVNELVKTVESGVNKMAKSLDDGLERMQQSLRQFSNGATSSTMQKNKELASSFDSVADAIKKATSSSGIGSYGGMGGKAVANTRTQEEVRLGLALRSIERERNAIQKTIDELETKISEKATKKIVGLEERIEQAKQRIKGFQTEIAGLEFRQRVDGVDNSQAIQVARNNIQRLKQEIVEYQEQIRKAPEFFGKKEIAQINELRQRLQQLSQQQEELRNKPITPIGQKEIANAERYSEEIKKQAQAIQAENNALQQNAALWQQDRQSRIDAGLAAQEQAQKIINAMHFQAGKDSDSPILGIKELREELVKMNQAWTLMSDTEKKSPIGASLRQNIAAAKQALTAVEGYNWSLAKMSNSAKDADPSIQHLSNNLKGLRSELESLSKTELFGKEGMSMRQRFQDMTFEVREMQRILSRPVSLKAALGMDENSLDKIADKLQALNAYKRGINLADPKQAGEIKQVDAAIQRLVQRQNELMGNNARLTSSNNALARSFNYMKNRLAFYFSIGASTQFLKTLVDIRSQYEMNERALGILIGSAEYGTKVFNELSQMALVSPYTLIELSSAAKQLIAYDVAAKDVVDTTRRLADMAAAVGIPMERLTYALGQIKAYGYLNARDARMFANAGIPLVRELSEHYTQLEGRMVSVADVYDRIKKKAIDYNDVMQVINRMTDEGGKFFDYQAKMADTLKVRLANLTLAWNNMLNDIGKETQGVLTWTIGALRTLFLHWRSLDALIKNAGWVLGIRTLVLAIYYAALKAGNALGVTTKQMALSQVVGKRLAVMLRTLGQSLLTIAKSPITWWSLLAMAVFEAGSMILGANEAAKELNKTLREAGEENYKNINEFLNQYRDLRNSLYKTSEIPVNYVFQGQVVGSGTEKVTSPTNIGKEEATKAWDAMREQIELTTTASDEFVGQLIKIENLSERLRAGFKLLDDIQQVNSAFKELGDNAIKITQDWSQWWNLWLGTDGLIDNLKDFERELREVEKDFGGIEKAREARLTGKSTTIAKNDIENYDAALKILQNDLKKTTDSLNAFIANMGFSGNPAQVIEVYAKALEKITAQGQLNLQQAFVLQTEMEDARRKAVMNALAIRYNDEVAAAKATEDEKTRIELLASANRNLQMYNLYKNTTDKELAYWENFTKYMTENHKSEMQTLIQNMDEGINLQDEKFQAFIKRSVESYAKRHNTTYNNVFNHLRNLINNANAWEIFIKLTISTEGKKSFNEQLNDYDKRANELYTKIKRNNERVKQMESQGWNSSLSKYYKEYNAIMQETLEYQKEYNDITSVEKGGKSAKEITDAKKTETAARRGAAAATRAQRQAESELQKAFKDELSLIDKVRSQYKKMTDAGIDNTTALTMVTSQFENSIKHINSVLGKNGLPLFNIKTFAGSDDPNKILEMLDKQLKNAKSAKNIKPSEIKDLEVKIGELKVDAKVYNMKKVTDGLNNELSKIKDEYELMVSIDAMPELGNIFTDLFNIDTSQMPKNIEDVVARYQQAIDKALADSLYGGADMDVNDMLAPFDLLSGDLEKWAKETGVETGSGLYKGLEQAQKQIRDLVQKDKENTIKQYEDLRYKLADNAGKIAIEQEKLERLQQKLANETNEERRRLLELQIQDQQNVIARLKDEAVSTLSTYKNLFNSIVEHSARVTRRLAEQWKGALDNAVKNADNTYTIKDPNTGETATVSEEKYNRLLNQVNGKLRDTQGSFDKIREALSKGEDGLIDWAKGVELIAGEAQKAANIIKEVAGIAEGLGASENTVEIINDIAESIDGMATAAQGATQIANGDIIGGTLNVVKGLWQSVSSWFDNSNKRIDRKVKESERTVARLEVAYKRLERAVENSMGTAEIKARQAVKANKEAQLAQLENQLLLEKSRKSKNQDEDKIIQLEGEIQDLKFDIEDLGKAISDTLLGNDVKSAAESFVDTWVSAWKEGENTLDAINEKVDEMIYNLIKKAATSAIVGKILKPLYNAVDQYTSEVSEGGAELTMSELKALAALAGQLEVKIDTALGSFYNNLEAQDIITKGAANKDLSALQQGIQGITEDTAGALEAYMNIVSQQVFLHSDLLTQIRDAVVTMDGDIQLGTQAQMLLQLQQSYTVQMAIQSILEGWSNANGMAVRVELMN